MRGTVHLGSPGQEPLETWVTIPTRQPKRKAGFVILEDNAVVNFINADLNKRAAKLLAAMWLEAEYGTNEVHCAQGHLCDVTGMATSHIPLALRELEEKGIVLRLKVKGQRAFLLNPRFGFRGKEQQRREADRRFQEASQAKVPA